MVNTSPLAFASGSSDLKLLDQLANRDGFPPNPHPVGQTHIGERAIDEILQPEQAAGEHCAGSPLQ